MLLPTLGPLVDASRRTAQRFPLVLAAGVASAGAGMALADGLGNETQYLRLLAATTLGLPLLFALTFVAERRAPTPAVRWAIPAAGVIALVLF